MKGRFDTLQQRVSDLEQQLRESEKRQAKELSDMQALHQERLDGLITRIETVQEEKKVRKCAGVSGNADPSVSACKDKEGEKPARCLITTTMSEFFKVENNSLELTRIFKESFKDQR